MKFLQKFIKITVNWGKIVAKVERPFFNILTGIFLNFFFEIFGLENKTYADGILLEISQIFLW